MTFSMVFPFLGRNSRLLDVISANFFSFFVLKDFQIGQAGLLPAGFREGPSGGAGDCLCGGVSPPCLMQGRKGAVD